MSDAAAPRPYLKPVDAPIETLILDPLTAPVAKVAARFASPLFITALAFAARAGAVALFALDEPTWGVVCAVAGFILDSTDGKVARMRGQTVHVHETVDFVIDQVAFSAMAIGLLAGELSQDHDATAVTIGAFLAAYTVLLSLGGTRFRLLGELGVDWRTPGAVRGIFARPESPDAARLGLVRRVHARYAALQAAANRHRLLARPTAIEALVIVFVVAPLIGTPQWAIIVAIVVLVPDMVVNVASVLVMARVQDG